MENPSNLPSELPTFGQWIESFLGFRLPPIRLPQTAKNLDKAIGRLVLAGGDNLRARIDGNTSAVTARGKAVSKLIDAAGSQSATLVGRDADLTERAIQYAFKETILRQTNRESIAKKAAEIIRESPEESTNDAENSINDDWLNTFSNLSSTKSDADIQTLWAKILAGEIRNPGKFSILSLNKLAAIDSSDAKLIHDIFGFAIGGEFIFAGERSSLGKFLACEELGVLSGVDTMLYREITVASGHSYLFVFPEVVLKIAALKDNTVNIPSMNLTKFGKQLYPLSNDYRSTPEYRNDFINHIKNRCADDIIIEQATVVARRGNITEFNLDFQPLHDTNSKITDVK